MTVTVNAKAYHERVKQYLPGGVHYNFHLPWEETPLHFMKASKSKVWDIEEKEYLDLYARFGALIVGHGHEEYNEALKSTIDRVLSVSHCDMDAEALELINRFVPSAEMIRFGVSGTEIVQNALRVARAWTGKNKFIRFIGHYHGNADNIMGGKSSKQGHIPQEYFGDLKGTRGRAEHIMEQQSYLLPWNDSALLQHFLDEHRDEIAAIIMEPVCVNGGGVTPAIDYMKKVRALCDEHGIVLIFDEIITGIRMGLGGAQQTFGVTPDLTTLGKAIAGGGVPVAALAGKQEIMKLLVDKKVIHAGTFNGYPLGTAAVKATLEILSRREGEALAHMNAVMEQIHHSMLQAAKRHNVELIIQGPTGCASYHCCAEPLASTEHYNFELMSKDIILHNKLAEHGILVSSISRMYPNISLGQADVAWFNERIDAALHDTKLIFDEML